MKCYQITQDGECVALVNDFGMARAIVECRPRGIYTVTEIEVGRPTSRRKKLTRKPSINPPGAQRRRKLFKGPSPWIFGPAIGTIGQSRPHAR